MNYPKVVKRSSVNGSLRTNVTLMAILYYVRPNLLLRVLLKKNGINYKKAFSPLSKKDSLRIIITLVARYDLELHQMDVKTIFLNQNLEEEIYMDQLESFSIKGKEHMVCKLKKSIYGLKQSSRNGILSLVKPLLPLDLQKTLLIGVYI